VEIDLLGRFAVRRDGREIGLGAFGGRLARRLVRILAAHRGHVVTRDALMDALWEERPPADPDANLNALVNRARRALADPDVIVTVPRGYVLRGADVVVDAERFSEYVDQASTALAAGDPRVAAAAAASARALWPGQPLPEDACAAWAGPLRDRLYRRYQEVLEVGAAAALAVGDAGRAGDLAAEAVSRQPLREAGHLLLIRALAAGGDQAAALAAYDELRRTLAEELGVDPSPQVAELQLRLLRGELREPAKHQQMVEGTPFVGRDAELTTLAELGGDRRVALVAGRAGSGKSRLLAELVARTARRVFVARAISPERDAPWSLARTLLQAAVDGGVDVCRLLPPRTVGCLVDLLPTLHGPRAEVEPQTWRALVLQGAVRVLQGRGLLVLDDLQWADSTSLELLALLAQRGDEPAMVLAFRSEEVVDGSPLSQFLAELRATGRPVELRLGRLTAESVTRLVAAADVAAVLAEETDGTPFGVLEAIREVHRMGALGRDRSGMWRPEAADVVDQTRRAARLGRQRAIWARVQRQPPRPRELLGLLALLGRPAPAALLAAAAGSGESEVLAALQQLALAELVRHGASGFAVAHDLVGETVRDRLDAVERARLHQQLARALDADAAAEEVARHLAGAGDRPAAASAYLAAARDRMTRFADREAESLADEGLALQPAPQTRAALLEVRAETRARHSELVAARDDLRAALALTGAGATRSRLLTRLAMLAFGAEDLLRAESLADLALAEARDEPAARARALHVGALIDVNLRRPARAQSRFDEAFELFSRVGDGNGVADVLDARAMAQFMNGDLDGAIEALDRVARMFADAGNLIRVTTPRCARALALVYSAEPDAGVAEADDALEMARSLGHAENEGGALWNRAEALAATGRAAEALTAADEAVAIARRIGHRGWTATALSARGIALHGAGDLSGAEVALRESLASSQNVPLFACWAHARLAMVLTAQGRLDEAATHAEKALATGPPIGQFAARLARCELAVARDEPADELIAEATRLAKAGGHRASLPRLAELLRKITR
jgi:DNA-binding SARP family transcriptional activator